MGLFQQIVQQCRSKYDSKPTLTLQQVASKREFLWEIEQMLKAMLPREIYQASKDLCEIFSVLVQSQAGFSLTLDIANLLKTYKIDPSLIINDFGKKEQSGPARIQAIQLLGHVFERVPVMGPPAKEIFDALMKQVGKFAELRVAGFTTINFVLKSGHLMQHSDYVLKTLLKAIQSADKESRELICACLATQASDYPSTLVSWQNVWPELMQTAIKQMEICESATLMIALMQARLNESKLQQDLKTSFKTYNLQQRDAKKKNLDVPRTLADMVSFFAAMMHKIVSCEVTAAQQNIRTGVAQTLITLFENNCEHLESVPFEALLNSLLLTIPGEKESAVESIRQREIVTVILTRASDALSQADVYKKDLMVFTLQSLKQNQLLLKMETLQEFQSYAGGKNTKISTLFHDGHQSCLLRLLNELISQMDSDSLRAVAEEFADLIDHVLVYLTQQETRIFAVEVIQSLCLARAVQIHKMISVVLSNVQITTADIQSMKQGFIYTNDRALLPSIETLNSQSQALACLFKIVPKVVGGEPVALAITVFYSARQQILGKIEPEAYQSLEFSKTGQAMRREAGWIMLEGLIYLGQNWVNSNIDSLLVLFKTVFSKSMCQVDFTGRESDLNYKEAFIQEFRIKQRAISALLALLSNCKIDSSAQKTISQLVIYAFTFLFPKDKTLLSGMGFGSEFKEAQSDLLGCLNRLPLRHFQHKFVGFLHSISDVIVSEDVEFQAMDEQDTLASKIQTSKLKQILVTDARTQYKSPILRLDKSLARLDLCQDYCSDSLVANAIAMFVKIFASSTLNVKNKDQLAKHLAVHTAQSIKTDKVTQKQVALPYRPEKIRKLSRIGKTICEYLQIQDRAVYPNEEKMVQEILANLQNPDLKAQFMILCSEIQIAADQQKILTQGVGQFVDVLEQNLSAHLKHNNIPKLIYTAAYCGHLVRNFDARIGIPFDRITNIFFKLLSDTDSTLHRYSIHFLADICQESAEFASQIVPICFDVIYGAASQINQRQLLRLLHSCHMWDDSKTSKILIADKINDQKVLYNFALKDRNDAQILARVVEGELSAPLLDLLVSTGKISQLELKFKDKGLLHVLIEHLNTDGQNTPWLLLYRKVQALTLPMHPFLVHLTLLRGCIAYSHLSPLMAFETKQVNLYKRKLSVQTVITLITEFTLFLKNNDTLPTNHALELLTFALSVVSQNEKKLKIAGLDLIQLAITFLKDKTEQVGDVEENDKLSPRSRQLNQYLQNPLLLEQYEAQIFSVIRQHLTGDQQPEVVQGTLDLIFTFVTLPITKDQSLVKKILHMLASGMEKGVKLLGAEMFSHEGLITETHFLKLDLLAKLFLKSKLVPEPGQPSKFNNEDRESLAELFTSRMLQTLQTHWKFALQDCLVLDLGQQGDLNLVTFVQGGTYSRTTLFSVVPSLLQALLHLNPDLEVQNLITASLFKGLLTKYDPNADLHQFYKSKVTLLTLTQAYLQRPFASSCVSELLQILQHLTTLGILEITKKVLHIYIDLCENHAQHVKLDLLQTVMGQLQQSQPELNDNLQLSLTSPNPEMIQICLKCLTHVSKYIIKYDAERVDYLFGIAVARVCLQLNKISDLQQAPYVKYIEDVTRSITTVTSKLSSLTLAILTEMQKMELNQSQIIVFTHLLRLVTVEDMAAAGDLIKGVQSITLLRNINLDTITVDHISKQLLKEALVFAHNDFKDGAPVCMRLIFKMYQQLSTEVRSQLLVVYIALLLQVIQTDFDQQVKLLAVANLFEVFMLDNEAFKNFATSTCERGFFLLTPVEQTVIENLIRNYQTKVASIQPSVPAKSTLAPPTQAGKSIKLGIGFKK